jgi:parallel beta-helix repeat protein
VDAGSAPVATLGINGSTASGGYPDVGVADIGYHYAAAAAQHVSVSTPYMPLFVRQDGNDVASGLDPSSALGTISAAGLRAVAGMTIVVGPGRYAEGDIRVKNRSGRVTFLADPSGVTTGDLPGSVLVDATGFDTGFVVVDSDNVTIRGFHVTGAQTAGIQVRAGANGARVLDNVVFSNQQRGIEIAGADTGTIRNNLVYANGTGGIRVAQSQGSVVVNNTVYRNGDVGILIGGSAGTDAAPGTSVLRNIVATNGKGVKVETNSFSGYVTGFNIVPDGFAANTPRADSDFIDDPLFLDPNGSDGVLGGAGFPDDDFHLLQDSDIVSPAVDVDFSTVNALASGSTRADGLPDLGSADAGYHYPFLPIMPAASDVAQIVFVRGAGSDADTGASPDHAYASVHQALGAMRGNGLIVIAPGTYREPKLRLGGRNGTGELTVLLGDEQGALTGDLPGHVTIDAGGSGTQTVTGPVLIDGVTWTGARGPGLRVVSSARGVTIRNSTFCGNADSGLVSTGDGVSVLNDLMFGNGGAGLDVRLRGVQQWTQVLNTTVAANEGPGITLRETTRGSSHALLYNNLVSGNGGSGITARTIGGAAPDAGSNLNTDGYGAGTVAASGDVTAAPQFTGTPVRTIRCAGSTAFYVDPSSPAIDAGVGTAAEIGLGIRAVTRTGSADTGATDLGFHYLRSQ